MLLISVYQCCQYHPKKGIFFLVSVASLRKEEARGLISVASVNMEGLGSLSSNM